MKAGVIDKEILRRFLPEAPVIVDCGAHTGVDSLELARMWPKGVVHAVEPVPAILEKLRANVESIPNIRVHAIALGTNNGSTNMFVSSGASDGSSSLLKPKEHLTEHPAVSFDTQVEVPTKTLHTWMADEHIGHTDLLWLDMQGYEPALLRAHSDILKNVRVIYSEVNLVELYEGAETYPSYRKFLEEQGFVVAREYLAWKDAGNVLFVKKEVYKQSKLPITAIIVGCNEGPLLADCLDSADFCCERIVIDCESTDGSSEIARAHGARVLAHKRMPIVEQVRQYGADHATQPWLLFLDPDERVMPALIPDIKGRTHEDVGLISVPCVFYVGDHALTGTVWGSRARPLLIHCDRATIRTAVHGGYEVLPPYVTEVVKRHGNNYIEHLWMQSVEQFFEKHRRYAAHEGPARYARGERASWKSFAYRPLAAFIECYFTKKGYRDGMLGLVMSVGYAWYIYRAYLSLLQYQQTQKP